MKYYLISEHPVKKVKSNLAAAGLVNNWKEKLTNKYTHVPSASSRASSRASGPPSSNDGESEPADNENVHASDWAEDDDNVERQTLEDDGLVLNWRKPSGTHIYVSAAASQPTNNDTTKASDGKMVRAGDKDVGALNKKAAAPIKVCAASC